MNAIRFGRLESVLKSAATINQQAIEMKLWSDEATQNFIIDRITFEQLFKLGVDGDDNGLGYYSAFTESLNSGKTFTVNGESKKKEMGDNYFLYDSGSFYASFKMIPNPSGFGVNADTVKEDGTDLARKFGIDILKPSNESISSLVSAVIPYIVDEVRRTILK